MKKILLLATVLMCAACAPPPSVVVRKDVQIERLGVCLDYGPQAIPLITGQFEQKLETFINRYNNLPGKTLKLYRATPLDSSTLRIKLLGTQLVTPGQQTAGAMVSLVGLSLPFLMIHAGAPVYIFFYYFPRTRSATELSLSPDISGLAVQAPGRGFMLTSPAFLMAPEKQLNRHADSFDVMLSRLLLDVERQQLRKPKNPNADQRVRQRTPI